MKKKLLALVSAIVLAVVGLTVVAPAAPASAANRACMTRAEYRAIHTNQTPTRVRQIVGSSGTTVYDVDNGYYEGAWVPIYDYVENWDGGFDQWGNPTYSYDWQVVDYYFDEYAGAYHPLRDTIKTFRKCWSSSGRASVWYDNYTQTGSGMRVYMKATRNLAASVAYARSAGPAAAKGEQRPARPAEPKVPAPKVAPKG